MSELHRLSSDLGPYGVGPTMKKSMPDQLCPKCGALMQLRDRRGGKVPTRSATRKQATRKAIKDITLEQAAGTIRAWVGQPQQGGTITGIGIPAGTPIKLRLEKLRGRHLERFQSAQDRGDDEVSSYWSRRAMDVATAIYVVCHDLENEDL